MPDTKIPSPFTPTDPLQRAMNDGFDNCEKLYAQMGIVFAQLSRAIWSNPRSAGGPQKAFDFLGPRGATVFKLAAGYITFVKATTGADLPSPVPAGWTYAVNDDGSVTVTEPPTLAIEDQIADSLTTIRRYNPRGLEVSVETSTKTIATLTDAIADPANADQRESIQAKIDGLQTTLAAQQKLLNDAVAIVQPAQTLLWQTLLPRWQAASAATFATPADAMPDLLAKVKRPEGI